MTTYCRKSGHQTPDRNCGEHQKEGEGKRQKAQKLSLFILRDYFLITHSANRTQYGNQGGPQFFADIGTNLFNINGMVKEKQSEGGRKNGEQEEKPHIGMLREDESANSSDSRKIQTYKGMLCA